MMLYKGQTWTELSYIYNKCIFKNSKGMITTKHRRVLTSGVGGVQRGTVINEFMAEPLHEPTSRMFMISTWRFPSLKKSFMQLLPTSYLFYIW